MGRDWNEKYASGEWNDKPPEPLVVEAARLRSPGRALDLACGPGRNALYLAKHNWDVTAVDSSPVALAMLSEGASGIATVHPVLADLETDEFAIEPRNWDLIIDCCYLQRSLFPDIKKGLRAGGVFVGVFPMTGINPRFLMRPGEGREFFGDWRLLQYREAERTEILAAKP
jgi:tellurite methyltransferase